MREGVIGSRGVVYMWGLDTEWEQHIFPCMDFMSSLVQEHSQIPQEKLEEVAVESYVWETWPSIANRINW